MRDGRKAAGAARPAHLGVLVQVSASNPFDLHLMDIFTQKTIKISLSSWCLHLTLLDYKGPFPLSVASRGLSPSSAALTTLPGAAQPILADSLPSANISVLLEPGELGVGNKDSTLLSGGRTYSEGLWQSVFLRLPWGF